MQEPVVMSPCLPLRSAAAVSRPYDRFAAGSTHHEAHEDHEEGSEGRLAPEWSPAIFRPPDSPSGLPSCPFMLFMVKTAVVRVCANKGIAGPRDSVVRTPVLGAPHRSVKWPGRSVAGASGSAVSDPADGHGLLRQPLGRRVEPPPTLRQLTVAQGMWGAPCRDFSPIIVSLFCA